MSIRAFVRVESTVVMDMCDRALELHESRHRRGAFALAQARKTLWGRLWTFDDSIMRDASLAWARSRIVELQSAAQLADSVLLSAEDAAWLRSTPVW